MFFIFPDMFSPEKTLPLLVHGLPPVPSVKSSSLYTTTLVRQQRKNSVLVMAVEESAETRARRRAHPDSKWRGVRWNRTSPLGRHPS